MCKVNPVGGLDTAGTHGDGYVHGGASKQRGRAWRGKHMRRPSPGNAWPPLAKGPKTQQSFFHMPWRAHRRPCVTMFFHAPACSGAARAASTCSRRRRAPVRQRRAPRRHLRRCQLRRGMGRLTDLSGTQAESAQRVQGLVQRLQGMEHCLQSGCWCFLHRWIHYFLAYSGMQDWIALSGVLRKAICTHRTLFSSSKKNILF
jgi:hypothetical protein